MKKAREINLNKLHLLLIGVVTPSIHPSVWLHHTLQGEYVLTPQPIVTKFYVLMGMDGKVTHAKIPFPNLNNLNMISADGI